MNEWIKFLAFISGCILGHIILSNLKVRWKLFWTVNLGIAWAIIETMIKMALQ